MIYGLVDSELRCSFGSFAPLLPVFLRPEPSLSDEHNVAVLISRAAFSIHFSRHIISRVRRESFVDFCRASSSSVHM